MELLPVTIWFVKSTTKMNPAFYKLCLQQFDLMIITHLIKLVLLRIIAINYDVGIVNLNEPFTCSENLLICVI